MTYSEAPKALVQWTTRSRREGLFSLARDLHLLGRGPRARGGSGRPRERDAVELNGALGVVEGLEEQDDPVVLRKHGRDAAVGRGDGIDIDSLLDRQAVGNGASDMISLRRRVEEVDVCSIVHGRERRVRGEPEIETRDAGNLLQPRKLARYTTTTSGPFHVAWDGRRRRSGAK